VLAFNSPLPNKAIGLGLTPLVGRETELAALRQLVVQSEARLITLIGPGGVGKTRLALEVAEALTSVQPVAFQAYFLSLEAIREPHAALVALTQLFGLEQVPSFNFFQNTELDLSAVVTREQTDKHSEAQQTNITTSLLNQLSARLKLTPPTVVVLDNLEQLISIGTLLLQLLATCPQLKLLATSREALRISGEYLFEVLPLTLPEMAQIETLVQRQPPSLTAGEILAQVQNASAVSLFVQRIRYVQPSFELSHHNASLVAQICHKLDGLPLALELAAARTRLFSLSELLTQLQKGLGLNVLRGGKRDLAQRQQTLRATIEWSYQLLSQPEQTLFRRLAVFKGGFSLEAVQTVCSESEMIIRPPTPLPQPRPQGQLLAGETAEDSSEILELLAALVEKSLVKRLQLTTISKDETGVGPADDLAYRLSVSALEASPSRFSLLELVREYAAERFIQTGSEETLAIAQRHAAYYTSLAKTAHSHLRGSAQQSYWLNRLEMEQPNLVAALAWLIHRHELAQALELSLDLGQFWILHSHLNYARTTLTTLLNQLKVALDQHVPTSPKICKEGQAGSDNGKTELEQAQEQDHSGNKVTPPLQLQAIVLAATLARLQGEIAQAQKLLQASETILGLLLASPHEEATIASLKATLLLEKGHLALAGGQYQAAQSYFEQSLALYHSINAPLEQAEVYARLGMLAENRSEYFKASDYYQQSLELAARLGATRWLSQAFTSLGRLEGVQGRYDQAYSYYAQALKGYRQLGYSQGIRLVLNNLGVLAKNQGQLKQARHFYEESLALARRVGDQQAIALTLANLGQVAQLEGDYEQATTLAEESLNLCRHLVEPKRTAHALLLVASLARQQQHYAQSRQAYQESLVLFHQLGYERGSAEALAGLAEVEAAQGQLEGAIRLWGLAERLREKHGLSLPPVLKPQYERQVQEARLRLGEIAARRSWASGRTMSIEQALAGVKTDDHQLNQPNQKREGRKAQSHKAKGEVAPALASLTRREVEVLRLVAAGLTNVQIAQQLVLSQRTVNSHLTAIFSKLAVNTRSAATRWAIEHHLS
jgi:predicted ATPase/DNA-binding CsgD family transcriptional regulator